MHTVYRAVRLPPGCFVFFEVIVLKRICVYCGSSPGARPEYAQAARSLGAALARQGLGLVYGGARMGIMGEVARAALAGGAEVTGVVPRELARRDVVFDELADLRIVGSMHERKALMAELADGFIALPGGFGTLEELAEMLTWAQLGMHRKPCGLLNVCGYYDRLIGFLDHAVEQQFMTMEHRLMLLVDERPESLLQKLRLYQPPSVDKAAWALGLSGGQS